jgi:thymidylate synthase (FAD)
MKATYQDHMGSDMSVVNAAKVSNGKRSTWSPDMSDKDNRLIGFLARGCTIGDWDEILQEIDDSQDPDDIEHHINYLRRMPTHWSPFAHTAITLHLNMPIFVARQIMKHTTGIEYNEISRRYVDDPPELFAPDVWRSKAVNVKHGSGGAHPKSVGCSVLYEAAAQTALAAYDAMIADGVAPEQARMILPLSLYTEVIATGNLYAWCNLYTQRTDPHAQEETRDIAHQIGGIIAPLFPVSFMELTK